MHSLRRTLAKALDQFRRVKNLEEVFGYPEAITPFEYFKAYRRWDIAQRIVSAYPHATWRDTPTVEDDRGEQSQFREAFENLYAAFDLGSVLERADRLASIGRFGVLFLGFRDGLSPDQPLEGNAELIQLTPFSEHLVQISQWEADPSSPRFGMPTLYTIQVGSRSGNSQSILVHYSRVIHIVEHKDEDPVYGNPKLEPVYNRLLDLLKIVGSGAETFWLNANRGLNIKLGDDSQLTPEELKNVKQMGEDYQNELRRVLVTQGAEIESIGSDIADPTANFKIQIDLIAGTTGIPQRILLGNEAGQLASDQDENNWVARVDERRTHFAATEIISPLLDMLIKTGNMPTPVGQYKITWPETQTLNPTDRATIANNQSQALANYLRTPGAEDIVSASEFRELLGMDPELPDVLEGIDEPEPDPNEFDDVR